MNYLIAAYAVFWILTFALVFSIFARQKAVERDVNALRAILDERTAEDRRNSR
jgi:CcmD family protein